MRVLNTFQVGLTPYLLPTYSFLTWLANPLIEVAISVSKSTDYQDSSCVATVFMAGLVSVACIGTKMKLQL